MQALATARSFPRIYFWQVMESFRDPEVPDSMQDAPSDVPCIRGRFLSGAPVGLRPGGGRLASPAGWSARTGPGGNGHAGEADGHRPALMLHCTKPLPIAGKQD
ncbi:hypothetical protein GCM10007897_35140 [Sphingobium jiangsuense]|nr:hypothetical protein GCM10007897_35140 [Sphingobium jiangsuense]